MALRIIADGGHDWKKYTGPVHGVLMIGTVNDGSHESALGLLAGRYVAVRCGETFRLTQRDVIRALTPKKASTAGRSVSVYLHESEINRLKDIGGGNLTAGIRIAMNSKIAKG